MSALGDKISANILAQTAQVPSIPWSGANITSALNAEGVIPQEAFNKACINTAEEAAAMAEKIGKSFHSFDFLSTNETTRLSCYDQGLRRWWRQGHSHGARSF